MASSLIGKVTARDILNDPDHVCCANHVQVMHLAEGCIRDKGVLEALNSCRGAAKIGQLLPALLRLSYRLTSGT